MRIALALVSFATLSGCSYSLPPLSASARARILRETTLDALPDGAAESSDGVVRVIRTGNTPTRCSGALVDARHVLTSAHCIVRRDAHRELVAGPSEGPVDAGDLHVELGGGPLPWGRVGVHLVRSCAGYVGDLEHDLAVLVLSKPVPDVKPFDLGYDAPREASVYELGGFGSSREQRVIPDTRWFAMSVERHVIHGPVLAVSDASISVRVPARPGDSGGPIVDAATGRLVSIVSVGRAIDEDATLAGTAEAPHGEYPIAAGPRLGTCRATIDEALAR